MHISRRGFFGGIVSTAVASAASADYLPTLVMPMFRSMVHSYEAPAKFRSVEDLIEFCGLCKIDTVKGITEFSPRPYQIEYLKRLHGSGSSFVCPKCRQCGVTTMNLVYAHWVLSRFPNKRIHFITPKTDMALESQKRFEAMREAHPMNGSTIRFLSASKLSEQLEAMAKARNASNPKYQNMPGHEQVLYKYDCLTSQFNSDDIFIFDEYAFFTNDHNLGIEASIWRSGAKLIFASTPNYDDHSVCAGVFKDHTRLHETWGEVNGMKIGWRDVPGWDDEWKARQCSILGEDRFKQEFEV